jgi:hypothetical protein
MTPENDPPAVDLDGSAAGTGFSTTFTEGNGAVTIADTDSDITDVDSDNLSQMTVTLTNAQDGSAESLSIAAGDVPAGMTATPAGDGHSITFAGSFTLAQYESVLEAVKYDNSSQDPDTTTRTVDVQVTDDTGQNSNVAVASIAMTPENDAPTINSLTAKVTEEGLADANDDTDGNPDEVNDVTPLVATGTFTVTDVDNQAGDFTFSLSNPPALTSGNVALDWSTNTEATELIGTKGDGGAEVIRIAIDASTGAYTVTLSGPIDHGTPGTSPGDEEQESFNVTVTVNDGIADATGTLTVVIEDDSPVVEGTFDGLMTNATNTSLTADLGIEYGADGPGAVVLTGIADNDPVMGIVGGVANQQLTADGIGLIYQLSGGVLQAVMDPDFTPPEGSIYDATHVAFAVSLDATAGTYSVSIVDGLDGGPEITTVGLSSGGVPGNTSSGGEYYLDFNENSVLVIAGDTAGQDTVNRNIHGMGAGNPFVDIGDTLTVELYDTVGGARIDFGTVTVETYNFDDDEEGYYVLYDDGVPVSGQIAFTHTSANFTPDATDSNLGSLTISSTESSTGDFNGVVFGSNVGEYTLSTFSAIDTSEAFDSTVSFNFSATDGDEDSTTGTFDVTFDGDGNLEGTAGADTLALSSGDDTLSSLGGDDTFFGGDGGDVINLGDVTGSTITVDGGDGYDIVTFDNDLDLGDGTLSLSNVEALDVTGTDNNALTISYEDVLGATDDGDILQIYGDTGDTVELESGSGTWVEGASNGTATVYEFQVGGTPEATVIIDNAIAVTNPDDIP